MNQGLIYLLILDFLLRFMLQPAMSQEIKPYLLMPVKKNKLVDTLLLQSGISSYNFFWFFLIIPLLCLRLSVSTDSRASYAICAAFGF